MRIGVLALQGGFAEHITALKKLSIDTFEIRRKADLRGIIDGLVIPGGESTVIGRLLAETELFNPIKEMLNGGLPTFGTCAGMIMLAEKIENDPITYFGCMDILVKRNAYGRQLGSFHTEGFFTHVGNVPMTFIRAPSIVTTGDNVRVLAEVNGIKVAAESGSILVTSFHPELTQDLRIHQYFLDKISSQNARS